MPRPLIALLILIAAGIVRLPVEHAITEAQEKAGFKRVNLTLDLRTQVSQAGFIAALGGYRSLVANMLWLQAHTAWEKTQWEKMYLIFNTVTTLQPSAIVFWDMAAWHMAWNASVAARRDESIPLEALRIRAQQRYIQMGKDLLERGIENNPDQALLYEKLGMLDRDKLEDHCAAAEAFRIGATKADAMPYVKRFAAYELSRCPGHEQEAYDELMRLYNMGEEQRLPTLIVQIKEMETALNIPPDRRIPDEHPDVVRKRREQAGREKALKEKGSGSAPPVVPGTASPLPGQPARP